VCLSLLACAALARREKVKLAEDRQSRARELDAARVAAEPYRRFTQARQSAEALAVDAPEREEYVSEARLWLETAITEAETAALARERLALERTTLRHDEAYLAAERERLTIEDERERALAAQIAREEMTRALTRAASVPALRVKLSADETRRAAQALLTRAELIALAVNPAREPEARSALLSQLEKARALLPKAPEEALTLADQALLSGLALAGKGRDPGTPTTAAQKAALAEALGLTGAAVTRAEHGLVAALKAKSKGTSIARLCGLARDYPAGDVQVVLNSARAENKGAGSESLAQSGCVGARFLIERRAAAQDSAHISFTFVAY
jgi:hypothetical protein